MGVLSKRTLTKTRRKTRDVDQIKADMASSKHLGQFKNSKAPDDLPDLGRNYCVECARWFDNSSTLIAHRKGKPHKRRLKQLRDEPDAQKFPGGAAPADAQDTTQTETTNSQTDVNMAS